MSFGVVAMMCRRSCLIVTILLAGSWCLRGDEPVKLDTSSGDKMIAAYFKEETRRLSENCLAEIKTLDDWTSRREEYRRQLREMLGLEPLPEKTPLQPVVMGKIDH